MRCRTETPPSSARPRATAVLRGTAARLARGARLSFALVASLGAGACSLSPGQPWGRAALSLEVAFAPPEDRLLDDGRLLTAKSFAVRVDELRLDLAAVEVVQVAAGTASNDGADDGAVVVPGSCHGGHCHGADGSLVPEDEVGGGGEAEEIVVAREIVAPIVLPGDGTAVAELGPCANDCLLERGVVEHLHVVADGELRLTGVVDDLLTGDRRRLSDDGVPIVLRAPLSGEIEALIDVLVDRGAPVDVPLAALLSIAPGLLDDVDMEDHLRAGFVIVDEETAPDAAAAVAEAVVSESVLEVAVGDREEAP